MKLQRHPGNPILSPNPQNPWEDLAVFNPAAWYDQEKRQVLLLYRTARLEVDPARKKEGARQAVASLQQALKANPLLEREYGPVLADARLDAGMIGAPPVKL